MSHGSTRNRMQGTAQADYAPSIFHPNANISQEDIVIPPNYSVIVVDHYEISSGTTTEIGSGGFLEIT